MWIVPFTPFTFSPERAAASSPTSSPACNPSAPSKSSHIPSASSPTASPASPSGTTCRPSAPTTPTAPNASRGCASIEPTSLSRAVSHARTFLARARAAASKEASGAAFGASSREHLARFDPASRSWKTPPSLLGADWESFSGIWPRSGMMLAGRCWPLETSARDTFASESGLPPLCGTACASGGGKSEVKPSAQARPRPLNCYGQETFPTVTINGNGNRYGQTKDGHPWGGIGLWTYLQNTRHPAHTTDCRGGRI